MMDPKAFEEIGKHTIMLGGSIFFSVATFATMMVEMVKHDEFSKYERSICDMVMGTFLVLAFACAGGALLWPFFFLFLAMGSLPLAATYAILRKERLKEEKKAKGLAEEAE